MLSGPRYHAVTTAGACSGTFLQNLVFVEVLGLGFGGFSGFRVLGLWGLGYRLQGLGSAQSISWEV